MYISAHIHHVFMPFALGIWCPLQNISGMSGVRKTSYTFIAPEVQALLIQLCPLGGDLNWLCWSGLMASLRVTSIS